MVWGAGKFVVKTARVYTLKCIAFLLKKNSNPPKTCSNSISLKKIIHSLCSLLTQVKPAFVNSLGMHSNLGPRLKLTDNDFLASDFSFPLSLCNVK